MKITKNDKTISSEEWDNRADSGYTKLEWVNSGDLLDEFLKFINPNKKDTVIDLGTGTGKIAEELSRRVKKVYGIDYSQKMLNLAPKRKNISYICSDAKDLGDMGLDNVDKIVARMVFHHLKSSLNEVMSYCREMLLPNGSLFLCEGIPPTKRAYNNWMETNNLLEKDRVFNTKDMWIKIFKKQKFTVSAMKTMAIKNLSTKNWLESRGESLETIRRIIALRTNMNKELKKDWNARIIGDDVFVDTYWFFLRADV